MRNYWRIFIVIEALLALLSLWQIFSTPGLAFLVIIGILNVVYSIKKNPRSTLNNFQLVLGITLISVGILNSPAFWCLLVVGVLCVGIKGTKNTSSNIRNHGPWSKKQFIIVETMNTENRSGRRFKRPWIKNERIGNDIYEWDDININVLIGDTIIDLGNTLLPKEDNIIIIRKGIGRTRILVPLGVAIQVEHSTLYGSVTFEEECYQLQNESLKLYSEDFDKNNRRLKLLMNTLVGDVEVIRV